MKKSDNLSLMLVTAKGEIKRVAAASFYDVRKSGIIAIKLDKDDRLVSTFFVRENDDVVLATHEGQAIHFKVSDVREMGRAAGGVRGIKLGGSDFVVGAQGIAKEETKKYEVLVISAGGYGKKTKLSEYKVQGRGGSGIKTFKIGTKTGKLVISQLVSDPASEIVAVSKKGQVIRVGVRDIPTLGRQTQGVRVMRLRAGDGIASASLVSIEEEPEE